MFRQLQQNTDKVSEAFTVFYTTLPELSKLCETGLFYLTAATSLLMASETEWEWLEYAW